MNIEQALELVEKLLYKQTGKYLSDLERSVFLGSWEGKTYEEIHPDNPQYLEKDVGYKLWKKLSQVTGEKVTKKSLQGAMSRSWNRLLQTNHLGHDYSSLKTAEVVDITQIKILILNPFETVQAELAQQICQTIQIAGIRATCIDTEGFPARDILAEDAANGETSYLLCAIEWQTP